MPSDEKRPKPPTRINKGQFETVKRLGAGCFGEVFRGTNTETKTDVAIKFETRSSKTAPQLEHEVEVIKILRSNSTPQGVVECFYFGQEANYNCMVMEMLGKSLEDQVRACKGKLTVKTTGLIAEQVLQRIEFLHSRGLVHRDIKPENFMFGIKDKVHHVYIIDFGLSKNYWDKLKDAHNPMKQKLSLTGTARYASINAHKGFEQGRRDDLEAIGHMLMYFLRGALPWSGLDAKTQEEKYLKICAKKEEIPLQDLCKGFPQAFQDYLRIARNLQFQERPDYVFLHKLMFDLRENGTKDMDYQWFDSKDWTAEAPLTALNPRTSPKQPDDKAKPVSKGFCFCCGGKSPTRD